MAKAVGDSLLDADAITQVRQLEVIATRIVDGYLSGRHRSPYTGSSPVFAEHRAYSPGDEVRVIDWRIYAKTDRYYIRKFEEETNLQAHLVVDASGSMGFGMATVSKLHYSLVACACLARLMLSQQDAVGLAVIDTQVRSYVPPRTRPSHFGVLLDEMTRVKPGGETSLAAVLHELARRLRRRGLVIICSDAFDDVQPLTHALHHLRTRGHETLLLHVMAPEELTFSFRKWSRFQCLEVPGQRIDLEPSVIRDDYLRRVRAFMEELRDGCAEAKCEYAPLATDRPVGDALSYYLRRRAARIKLR